jgi:hypothetical protein
MMVPFLACGIAAKLDRMLRAPLQAGKALLAAMLPSRYLMFFIDPMSSIGPMCAIGPMSSIGPMCLAALVDQHDIADGANPGADATSIARAIGIESAIHALAALQKGLVDRLLHARDLEPGPFLEGLLEIE